MCFRPAEANFKRRCDKCGQEDIDIDAAVCPNCGEPMPKMPGLPDSAPGAPGAPAAPKGPAAPSAPKPPTP